MSASDLARRRSMTDGRPQPAGRPAPGSNLGLRLEVSRPDDGDEVVLVRMAGEIDCYTAPELKEHLFAVVDDRPIARLDVDMAAVDFIDSTGLGVLVTALQRLRSDGGELHLRNLQPGTAKVFEMTGLATAFHVGTPPT